MYLVKVPLGHPVVPTLFKAISINAWSAQRHRSNAPHLRIFRCSQHHNLRVSESQPFHEWITAMYFQRVASDSLLLTIKLSLATTNSASVTISPHYMSVDCSQSSIQRAKPLAGDWLRYKAITITTINKRLKEGSELDENTLHSIAALSGIPVNCKSSILVCLSREDCHTDAFSF